MKKLFVLGMLLAMSTGCGRGWFPHLFRGAPCNGLCSAPAPTLQGGCENCPTASGYGAYDEGMAHAGETYIDNGVIGSAPVQTFETIPQGVPQLPTIGAPGK
ncbi:MAG: hypothetical protein IT423_02465 [Pirellulaceae bacterium]|nr:hypothetical protein [Pirellulaceae bacterium]